MSEVNISPATSKAVTSLLVFEASLNTTGTEKRVPQQSTFESVWNDQGKVSYSLGWLIDMIENN